MIYKRFSVQVIVRVLLLVATSFVLVYSLLEMQWRFTPVLLAVVLLFQVVVLIRYVQRTNRDLTKLFMAVRHADYSAGFSSDKKGKSFEELYGEFDAVIRAFRDNRIEKEAQYQYFKMMIEQLRVGILSVNKVGQITLMNRAAEEMLHLPNPGTWERLTNRLPSFAEEIEHIEPGGNRLLVFDSGGMTSHFSVQVNVIRLPGQESKVVTFRNIRSELELKEIEAWHKLIRILTHEIMNSVTPIASLTETLVDLLEAPASSEEGRPTASTMADVKMALNTIHKRSNGLLHFVSDYRKLTKVPAPRMGEIGIKALFDAMAQLYAAEFEKANIQLEIKPVPPKLFVKGDTRLIEQTLINLMVNARDALAEIPNGKVWLSASITEQHTTIQVADNGPGIPEEQLDQIFVPFFSTKDHGSGIGLSLARHIMKLHKGTLTIMSKPGEGAVFTLVFPL